MRNGKNILAALIFSLCSAKSFAATKTLTVGVSFRLNDAYNNSVRSLMSGVETAKAEFEKDHPGTVIQLKVLAHGADLASVNGVADKFISEKISAVIGGEMSEESLVFGDRLGAKKIVFFTPTSSNPKVTYDKPFVFSACFSDRAVATEMARYMKENLKPTAVGVIQNISSPYSDYLSNRFAETFSRMIAQNPKDRPLVLVEKVLRRTLDFSKQIKLFKDNNVSHVAIFSHDADVIQFVVQAEEQKFFPVYMGSDGWGSNQYVYEKFVKESKNGAKFVAIRNSYWKEDAENPIAKRFKSAYKKKYNRNPEAWSAVAFDTAWILFGAMSRAKDPNSGEDIRKELKKTSGVSLVTTDSFSFGEDNSPRKDLYLYRISKDGIQYEATLK
jgi:branched-chain amino acid transport system substrate-binding protein